MKLRLFKPVTVLFCLIVFLAVNVQAQDPKLTNQTILDMVGQKVPDSTIINMIRLADAEKTQFDVSAEMILQLKDAKVANDVITAMVAKARPVIDAEQDVPVLAALGARITGGAVFANGSFEVVPAANGTPASLRSPQFSEAATYLAIEVQPIWAVESIFNPAPSKPRKSRLGASAFFNVRLTTIPVSGTTQIAAPTKDLLVSQKAAQMQFGFVVDHHFRDFSLFSSRFHWAAGPLGRVMFQSVTDAQRAVRIWNLQDDLFDAYMGGLRLTLFQQQKLGENTSTTRWRPAAYMDASWGPFQNFETASAKPGLATTAAANICLATPSSCFENPLSKDAYNIKKKPRTYIEARLMLKYIYLGVDINNGLGRDDTRFIAGVTMTLDRFFGH